MIIYTDTTTKMHAGSSKKKKVVDYTLMASKAEQKDADNLLAQALAVASVPFNFVSTRYFKAYVAKISQLRYHTPGRKGLLARLDEIYERLQRIIARKLENAAYIAFEMDSWSRANKHLTSLTTGCPGLSAFMACYETDAPDTAWSNAAAAYQCISAFVLLFVSQLENKPHPALIIYCCGFDRYDVLFLFGMHWHIEGFVTRVHLQVLPRCDGLAKRPDTR